MKKVLVGILRPELLGVSNSRWVVQTDGEVHIVEWRRVVEILSEYGTRDVDYECVTIDTKLARLVVKQELIEHH